MASIRRPAILRAVVGIALATLASFGAVMTTPRPVVACSCVVFDSLKDAAGPRNAIFTGTVGPHRARGLSVEVDRWFWGAGSAPIVWLSNQSFGDSVSCGTAIPPIGSSWLWVGSPMVDGTFATGACSPHEDLATPDGQTLLAEAVAAFGAGPAPPGTADGTQDAASTTPLPGPADTARDRTAILIVGGLLLGSLALFGGLILAVRRSGALAHGRDGDGRGDGDRP